MLYTRVIPALLLRKNGLVKGVRFSEHRYVGDAMNAIRIFNTKEVDELMLLDIDATNQNRTISPELIRQVSSECLMPITVGGGIRTLDNVRALLNAGAEKVCIGTYAFINPGFISKVAETFGSQSIVISIDVKQNSSGAYEVYVNCGTRKTGEDPMTVAKRAESYGAGEILLNAIDRDGTMEGFDLDLIRNVSGSVNIPLIALGGAGGADHLREAVCDGGATAVAAGSFFVFHGRRRAVLISFPTRQELDNLFDLPKLAA